MKAPGKSKTYSYVALKIGLCALALRPLEHAYVNLGVHVLCCGLVLNSKDKNMRTMSALERNL